jgi:hypothetical protein
MKHDLLDGAAGEEIRCSAAVTEGVRNIGDVTDSECSCHAVDQLTKMGRRELEEEISRAEGARVQVAEEQQGDRGALQRYPLIAPSLGNR